MQHKLAINEMQKSAIRSALSYFFEDIEMLKPEVALKALKAITNKDLSEKDKNEFEEQNVYEAIKEIKKFLYDENPQNLLKLDIYNDNTALPITRGAVEGYIKELIEDAIKNQVKLQNQAEIQPKVEIGSSSRLFQTQNKPSITWKIEDTWEIHKGSDDVNRKKFYWAYNNDMKDMKPRTDVGIISQEGHTDGTYSLSFILAREVPDIVKKLNDLGFNNNYPSVTLPTTRLNMFRLHGSLDMMMQSLDKFFKVVEFVEGKHSIDAIREEIAKTFQQQVKKPMPGSG